MRVLVIHAQYKLKGGEDSVVANEIELMRSRGVTVELLPFNNSGGTLMKLMQIAFNFGSYHTTRKKIKDFRPDVVHIHNLHFSGSPAVVYAIREMNTPIVMTLHNYRMLCPSGSLYHHGQMFLDSLKGGFPWAAVKNKVYQHSSLITFWVAMSMYLHDKLDTWGNVHRFILLGEHSKEIFAKSRFAAYKDRMVIKPNFCQPSARVIVHQQQRAGYLYIGRLTAEKGIHILLEAFGNTTIPLTIVGTGPLEDVVRNHARNATNINYLGEQQREQIDSLLDHAEALIFPSVWYETFGMVVVEAFSKGVPVIASALGNMEKLVTNGLNGMTFEPGNSADLAQTISTYDNFAEEEKDIFRQNARQIYEAKYTPDTNFDMLAQIYQSAIQSHAGKV